MGAGGNERPLVGSWVWLFPLTYLIHIAEEQWGGEGFPAWVARFGGVPFTPANFLALNVGACLLMTVGLVLVLRFRAMRWLLCSFATVVLLNGLAHLAASLLTASYSPGLISGLLLWAPLGAAALARLRSRLTGRSFWSGVTVGLLMHAVVALLAFGASG